MIKIFSWINNFADAIIGLNVDIPCLSPLRNDTCTFIAHKEIFLIEVFFKMV